MLKIKGVKLLRLMAGFLVLSTIGFYALLETAMWGGSPARNMVSDETGLPAKWDPDSGMNIKWTGQLGSQTYGNPVIIGGKVFVGTNNQAERNPKLKGDRGVVMAFRESDGKFLWQAAHDKLAAGRVNDWPQQGICSSPFVEGERIYYISNRAQVVCADTEGFLDGENDGPVTDEEYTSDIDADFVWKYDMIDELDVFPHNLATCSPLLVGDLVFVVTGNGVDETHINIPSPSAPSFIALNKTTGELVWEDASPGENILHGQWSNPAYDVVNGQPQVVFPGGDGWLYSMVPETGEHIWKFNCNPEDAVWELGGAGTKNNIISTPVIYDNKVYVSVGQDPEHGEGIGHLWVIDATQKGDVTESAVVWHRGYDDYNRSMSTVAIHDDILYTADLSGFVYCLNAQNGEHYWTYDAFAAIWGSPYYVDGKVYIGDEDGDVAILKAGKKKELLNEINMANAVYTTPVAKNGTLFITNQSKLFAITM
ncbi:PQQ-binding-like beta-propeller repeat protein [candidate division KSB1 bacterium]|nr:PQQ-binding-like beta-propeller repeat protein [candidate division KSB1 bacterium]NIR69162.1 PQQ-binding-like beta-propeller repeat protein [candidate division KSB1 bacterium]NIS25673.1 PQQ-binding-like beta-propeller repeat protein [candidate division KSB1 bacterium]NIT72541.1 PQQ-binding-like beta-propeller repeat protein [candidate division KSB1 bacterium]NIU26350.1 PQQ-binding-like beta-propeller repeat protein [candidate division KSB1 bacterium]